MENSSRVQDSGAALGPFRRTIIAFLSLLLFFSTNLAAKPADLQDVRKAVRGWLKLDPNPLGTSLGKEVGKVDTFTDDDGKPSYYVVYLRPCGFVIVSADDQLEPIIAFASKGSYDPSDDNPLGALVSQDLPRRMAALSDVRAAPGTNSHQKHAHQHLKAFEKAKRKAQSKWTRLRSHGRQAATENVFDLVKEASDSIFKSSVTDIRVAPLVQSRWGQTTPANCSKECFNYFTPDHYRCGCVATAMAQLMRFYEHPTEAVGEKRFTIWVDDDEETRYTRGGNGSGGPYQWSLMDLVPDCGPSSSHREAIGALCFDAGISVGMSYAAGGSGANTSKIDNALIGTFDFTNALHAYEDSGISGSLLEKMVNSNLDAGYPVILGIESPTVEGHAILADGYGYNNATLYHHLNMGWNGDSNTWYDLPDIIHWNAVVTCVYNLYTSGSGEIISGRVTDENGEPVSGAAVTAVTPDNSYYATTNDTGIYAFAKLPAPQSYTISATKEDMAFSEKNVYLRRSRNESTDVGNLWGIDFARNVRELPVKDDLSVIYGAAHILDEGSDWYWNGSGTAEAEAVSYPKPYVMLIDTDNVTGQRARWYNTGFGDADETTGFTAQIAMRVLKSTSSSLGIDFELYSGDGSSSGNRYFVTVTQTGVYWYNGSFTEIAEGLDNSGRMHTYRMAVSDEMVHIFRDARLLAVKPADHSVDPTISGIGPYLQWGEGASGSEADVEVKYVAYDLSGAFRPEPVNTVLRFRFDGTLGSDIPDGLHDDTGNYAATIISGTDADSTIKYGASNSIYNTNGTSAEFYNNDWANNAGDTFLIPDATGINFGDFDAFTVELFVYPNSAGTGQTRRIFSEYIYVYMYLDGSNTLHAIRKWGGGNWNQNWTHLTKTNFPHNTWSHVAMTWDTNAAGDRFKLCINGKRVASAPGTSVPTLDSTAGFAIGGYQREDGSTAQFFVGKIDEVRISSTALERSQFLNSNLIIQDVDGDGDVDTQDLLVFAADWLCAGADCEADLDNDEDVDLGDFAIFAQKWLDGVLP